MDTRYDGPEPAGGPDRWMAAFALGFQPASVLALGRGHTNAGLNDPTALRLVSLAPQGSSSDADGWDETCRSGAFLASIRIAEELWKRRLGYHAEKLVQEAAFYGF